MKKTSHNEDLIALGNRKRSSRIQQITSNTPELSDDIVKEVLEVNNSLESLSKRDNLLIECIEFLKKTTSGNADK